MSQDEESVVAQDPLDEDEEPDEDLFEEELDEEPVDLFDADVPEVPEDPAEEGAAEVVVLFGAVVVLAVGEVVEVEKVGVVDFDALLWLVGVGVLELHAAAVSAIAITASTPCQARLCGCRIRRGSSAADFLGLITYCSFVFALWLG